MALVWHEKASHTALQTSTVNFTHTLLVQTHTHDFSSPSITIIHCRSLPLQNLVTVCLELKMVFNGYAGSSFDIVAVEQNDDFVNREYLSQFSVIFQRVKSIFNLTPTDNSPGIFGKIGIHSQVSRSTWTETRVSR